MATEPALPQSAYPSVRRWPRYKLDIPVRILLARPGKTMIVEGRGNELNEGGMAIFAGSEIALDERVAVEFTPPYTGQPIRVRCQVRSRTGYAYGVKFLTETPEDRVAAQEIRSILRGYGVLQK